jgi:DNA-binding NarL/FixJ family response regulator
MASSFTFLADEADVSISASRSRHAIIADADPRSADLLKTAVLACGAGARVVSSPADAEAAARALRADLLVVSLECGDRRFWLRLAESMQRASSASIVVIGSTFDDDTIGRLALHDRCYVLHRPFHGAQVRATIQLAIARQSERPKPTPPLDPRRRQLEQAMRDIGAILNGTVPVDDGPRPPNERALQALRPREREIVELLLNNCRVSAVATRLSISTHTVRNHLKHVYRRLGVHSQQALLDLFTAAPHQDGAAR